MSTPSMRGWAPVNALATTTVEPSTATSAVCGVRVTPWRNRRGERGTIDGTARPALGRSAARARDVPALLEEARGRRQALRRVDGVDNHDAIAGFDARLEPIAVGHHLRKTRENRLPSAPRLHLLCKPLSQHAVQKHVREAWRSP